MMICSIKLSKRKNEADKIKAFGARISPMGDLVEHGRWFAENEGPIKERRSTER